MEIGEHRTYVIRAFGRNCLGCQRHAAHVMISFQTERAGEITDLFLTEAQAVELLEELKRALE